MRLPRNTLEGLLFILFSIPIVLYYLIKWTVIGIVKLVIIFMSLFEKKDIEDVDFADIDTMDGIAFEHYVAKMLRCNNFSNVEVTKASGDFGVDVIAKKNKQRWVFQCKHYSSPLGIRPIQEVFAGKERYKAEVAVVVTNSRFTSHAIELADCLGVLLWDREKLCKMNKKIPEKITPPKDNYVKTPLRKRIIGDGEMATIIGAGKYVFGENIPLGKYDLKVVSGKGILKIQTEFDEDWLNFGKEEGFAETYSGLSLPKDWYFSLDGDLRVEISKSKMIEIE